MPLMTSKRASSAEADRALALCLEAVRAPNAPYAEQERRFARLDDLLLSDEGLAEPLLEDPRYQRIRDDFLLVRAAYEYERERVLAEAIIAAGDDSPLDAFLAAYRKALEDSTYPAGPAVVPSIRARFARSAEEFLQWAVSTLKWNWLMEKKLQP